MNRTPFVPPALLLAAAFGASAQSVGPAGSSPVPDGVPVPPPRVKSGEPLEPEAPAVGRERGSITEYRVSGHLRAVKVESEGFPAYWLLDTDADGRIDTDGNGRPGGRAAGLDSAGEMRPHWRIFSW